MLKKYFHLTIQRGTNLPETIYFKGTSVSTFLVLFAKVLPTTTVILYSREINPFEWLEVENDPILSFLIFDPPKLNKD